MEPGKYWFECAMISTCKPVFDKCADNYEVETMLRDARVIHKRTKTDTESSALVVLFASEKAGDSFIERLNAFLVLRV